MHEHRVCACWRVHACTAGLCAGAQLFLLGSGVALPLARNAAWIAALAALPAGALTAALCRRALVRRPGSGRRVADLLLALTLLLCAVTALCALISLSAQTLLPRAGTWWIAAVSLAAAALCALSGGTMRLCFALRWLLPVLLIGLAVLLLAPRPPLGIFPLLGAGGLPLAVAAACMPAAAAPLLMLLLPPSELTEMDTPCCPPAGFFVRRVLAGQAAGAALLLLSCAFSDPLADAGGWGARLHLIRVSQPRSSVSLTLLTIGQLMALTLLTACMLAVGSQALRCAVPCKAHTALALLTLLLGAAMALMSLWGYSAVLPFAPLLSVPTAALLLLHGRKGGRDA